MFEDFKKFAMKGNAIDLAVGLIIGSAFGKIVTSLVNDIIMPPIGALLGGIDFSGFVATVKPATETAKAVTINYGIFINTIIDFLIISFSIFLVIRQLNKFKLAGFKKDSDEVVILKEIRDELKKKNKKA